MRPAEAPGRRQPDEQFPCQEAPDVFFASIDDRTNGLNTPSARQAAKVARSLCAECPAIVECAEYAIRTDEYGIWGGLTRHERALSARERGIVQLSPRPITDYIVHADLYRDLSDIESLGGVDHHPLDRLVS